MILELSSFAASYHSKLIFKRNSNEFKDFFLAALPVSVLHPFGVKLVKDSKALLK